MNPERLRVIEELYHSASELPPEQREAFLSRACANDAELLVHVLGLLAQDTGPLAWPVGEVAGELLRDSSWTPGTQLGPYQIVSRLGEGGMGAVFKARDTRLGREVAIKTAHEGFGERFEREARAISSLNHANICTLHDVGPNYLVMELVEGKNLTGPVAISTAIDYASQLAAGLEAAHEKGIVHRDLKPANIRITPEGVVKILDFGLAKELENRTAGDTAATLSMTAKGMILGTAAYMSPEQARGEAVDKRADIWAFGVILYELLTGRMLFGESRNVSDVLAAVLTHEPDFGALPQGTPPRVRRILELCLRKDPKLRMRDMGDVRLRLEEPEPEAPAPPAPARRWWWVAGLAMFAVAAFAGYRWLAELPSGPFQRISITRLTDSGKASAAAISPDGKYVLHAVTDEGKSSLWLLHAATGSSVQLKASGEGSLSFLNFSRDGNTLYYLFSTGQGLPSVYTMPVLGGNPTRLDSFSGTGGLAISPDEKLLAFWKDASGDRGLFSRNLDGSGEQQIAARKFPDAFGTPAWSPDGKTIAYGVYSVADASSFLAGIPAAGGPERRLSPALGNNVGSLRWMPDAKGLIATANQQFPYFQLWYIDYPGGRARRITNDLNRYEGLSLSGNGKELVTVQSETISHLWVVPPGDPGSGREISRGRLDGLNYAAFAANGNLYFEAPDTTGFVHVWSSAPDGSGRRQITRGRGNSGQPTLCGDGRYLLFTSYRAGTPHIFQADPDGGNVRQLTSGGPAILPSCSPDGAWLTYYSFDPASIGVWRIPMQGGPAILIAKAEQRSYSEVSPDGQSVLIKQAGGKVLIVPAGGGPAIRSLDEVPSLGPWNVVHWSADGSALLYAQTAGGVTNIWQRPLDGGEPKQITAFTSQRITAFAVSRDGKRLALARGTTSSDVVLIKDLQ